MLARGRVFSVGLLLADQNKRAPEAMRYWFRVLDLNCTGVVDEECVRAFFLSQVPVRRGCEA